MSTDHGCPSALSPTVRAIAPLAGILLVAMTVLLGVTVTAVALDAPEEPAPMTMLSLSADGDRIALTHDGGDPINVQDLTVRVRVNDESLSRQPPVPFFSSAGFQPGPTGAFNSASDDTWIVGESVSFRIARSNDPYPTAGDRVEVHLSVHDREIAMLEATVRAS